MNVYLIVVLVLYIFKSAFMMGVVEKYYEKSFIRLITWNNSSDTFNTIRFSISFFTIPSFILICICHVLYNLYTLGRRE